METKHHAIVNAEVALNELLDTSKKGDSWALEQQKRTFLDSLQALIAKEVSTIQTQQNASQGEAFSYERIERFNKSSGKGSFANFVNNISTLPKTFFYLTVGVLAFFQFLHILFPRTM